MASRPWKFDMSDGYLGSVWDLLLSRACAKRVSSASASTLANETWRAECGTGLQWDERVPLRILGVQGTQLIRPCARINV